MPVSRLSHYSNQIKPLKSTSGILLLLVALVFYLAYSSTFSELETYWVEGYNWQFLIPIAFVYMLWERRDLFRQLDYQPNIALGSTLLLLSCAVLIAGQVSSTHALRELSIVSTVFSLSVLVLGIHPTRKLFWPIAYLILMTSLPTVALEMLRTPLKLISATVSAEVLQFFGYAIYREGAFLYLPHITLEVADSCSGVNQLTSSIALGIPIAFTVLNKTWKRLLIIFISAAFGIIMNWVRVVLISLWHYDSAKESIHGPKDIYGLPFIFMVGVFLTLVIAFAMAEKHSPSSRIDDSSTINPFTQLFSSHGFRSATITGIAILSLSAVYLHTWHAVPIRLAIPVSEFPMDIDSYKGKFLEGLDKPFYSGLADDEIIATYKKPADGTATVYIGYFRSQNQEKELIDYRYNWLQDGAEPFEQPGTSLRMKRKVVKTRKGVKTVFFEYDINGRNIVDMKQAKLASLIDAIFKRRNNGAIIMVIFDGVRKELSGSEERFLEKVVVKAQEMLP